MSPNSPVNYDDQAPTFGRALKHFRELAGRTQSDVAAYLRENQPGATWTYQAIGYWEKSGHVPERDACVLLDEWLTAEGALEAFAGRETDYVKDLSRRIAALEAAQERSGQEMQSLAAELRDALDARRDGSTSPRARRPARS